MLRFQMTVQGAKEIDAALIGLRLAHADLRPVWPEISYAMETMMTDRFNSEGGGTWPGLDEAYAKWRLRHYPSAGWMILRRSFRLHASLTDSTNSLGGDAIRDMSAPDQFRFGTSVPYAGAHHAGEGSVKRRKILDFTVLNQKVLMRIIHRFIIESLKGAKAGFNTGVGSSE